MAHGRTGSISSGDLGYDASEFYWLTVEDKNPRLVLFLYKANSCWYILDDLGRISYCYSEDAVLVHRRTKC